ncbi:MAG: SsrA-binding protein [Candidatus Lloydbacteria bacterium RIFCSPLOWO2_01_FULL_50_20]|uniref:SsrA-binding protein n=1 Tax=Candidatus Lloydbacteria bacterium RIFCSPLOWO2_01_FULL_50_20 TaxID=1798665 RepID=A0A1G2DDJ2_9BACT|nr:MAG: SsrA-binding protein [Candidatus Lloydbacteria bacterium RIFCSPHIGHO2_02_FULL_50_11]OGZ11704.1 MAG: SsrA-binding protein [Candidatus Lloydbacteria bacterium RIFCSPLOWO2_01_FULL_50_20]
MANLIEHKKAHFDYEILESYEAGIQLFGGEVKSVRAHRGKLEGAHITVRGGEAFLINSEIPPYQPGNETGGGYEPTRNRRLLLTKKELAELATAEEKAGLTIIPLSMYNKGRIIKIRIAIARGKKKSDKREAIKKREAIRDIAREVKQGVAREVKRLGNRLRLE